MLALVLAQVGRAGMYRVFFLMLWVLPSLPVVTVAAQTSMEGGARAAALGGANTALPEDVGGLANPAAWATLQGRAVTFFATQAFGLSELRLAALNYAEPTHLGTIAAGIRAFGFDAYRETHVYLGVARGLRLGTTRRFYLGVRLRYLHTTIPDYGSTGVLGLSIGGLVTMLPVLHLAFQTMNPHAPTSGDHEDQPRTLSVGLAYDPSPAWLIVMDAYKDVRFPLALRVGLEMHPVEALTLRTGFTSEPVRFTAGVGLRLGLVAADMAAERHEALGWSPAVAVGLRW